MDGRHGIFPGIGFSSASRYRSIRGREPDKGWKNADSPLQRSFFLPRFRSFALEAPRPIAPMRAKSIGFTASWHGCERSFAPQVFWTSNAWEPWGTRRNGFCSCATGKTMRTSSFSFTSAEDRRRCRCPFRPVHGPFDSTRRNEDGTGPEVCSPRRYRATEGISRSPLPPSPAPCTGVSTGHKTRASGLGFGLQDSGIRIPDVRFQPQSGSSLNPGP